MKNNPTIGILPLGRPTFDVPFAEERLAAMLGALDRTGRGVVGPRTLLFDAAAAREAIATLDAERPAQILILQATFTDASGAAHPLSKRVRATGRLDYAGVRNAGLFSDEDRRSHRKRR